MFLFTMFCWRPSRLEALDRDKYLRSHTDDNNNNNMNNNNNSKNDNIHNFNNQKYKKKTR